MVGCAPSRTCRPVTNWSCAPWSLSVVHSDRTTAMSSAQPPTCFHQSPTVSPHWPYFLWPVVSPISFLRLPCDGLPPTTSLSLSGLSAPLYGVSSIVLPSYFVSSGFTSKLS